MSFSRLWSTFSWNLLIVALCNGALINNIADIPNIKYDFIIVGGTQLRVLSTHCIHLIFYSGGASRNVVANKLSENPKYQVLVLEAGPS